MDAEAEREPAAEGRRDELLRSIRVLTRTHRRGKPNVVALAAELDGLITEIELLDPVLSEVLRQEWWRIELLGVGWQARVPGLSRRLLNHRLTRLDTIARFG